MPNQLLSPLSVASALHLALAGAGGNTHAQMRDVLNLQELDPKTVLGNNNTNTSQVLRMLDDVMQR